MFILTLILWYGLISYASILASSDVSQTMVFLVTNKIALLISTSSNLSTSYKSFTFFGSVIPLK